MFIYAEVRPLAKREELESLLEELGAFHGLDIPDAPMGRPAPLPVYVACMARKIHPSKPIIINQRLIDVDELYVRSLLVTAKALGLSVAFTRGDEPRVGRAVGYLSSEEAVELAREEGVRAGMMLSMAYPRGDVENRARSGADFFLVLNLAEPRQLIGLEASRMIPYLLVATDANREWIGKLGQPTVKEEDLPTLLGELEEVGVGAVLLSIPRDSKAFHRIAKALKL